jgi:hypothetical protein
VLPIAAAAALLASATAQAADVGVSIGVAQPGVYGRIDIGRFPQPPAVIAPQPVVIEAPRVVAARPVQPVYLWVPPGHQRDWRRHCHRYDACGVPVYFVRRDWYEAHVMEPHRGGGNGHGPGRGHGKGRD